MVAQHQVNPIRFQQVFWFGLILAVAAGIGYFLATDSTILALLLMGTVWLVSLPYHCKISIRVAVATFSSALILPFFPGRPFLWESAALLGWSGLLIVIAMRRYAPDSLQQIRQHGWLLFGAAGYCAVLLVTMYYRGFGLRIFGGDQMGGRFYFQQLSCAIFPLVFMMSRIDEATVVKLFTLQCVLTVTYVVSDFVFSIAPKELYIVLRFFELPGDAGNFEMQAERFGIRRYQSLYYLSTGMIYLLLTRFNLKSFLTLRGVFLIPLTLLITLIGMLSGHRYLALILCITIFFCAYSQRFYTVKNVLIAIGTFAILVPATYVFAERLPLAAQRVISFLPGINVENEAKISALSTLETRRILREIGMTLAPQYFWLGRGFGQSAHGDFSYEWDQTSIQFHINQGKFYNGFVGLLVNTGIFGTTFMLLFLAAGTVIALKVMTLLRADDCLDVFGRTSSVLAGLWMANVIAFLFLHGDSEYAMKTFSLQAGMLLTCLYHLTQRKGAKEQFQ